MGSGFVAGVKRQRAIAVGSGMDNENKMVSLVAVLFALGVYCIEFCLRS